MWILEQLAQLKQIKRYLELTENGETLGVNDYNKDGEIILEIAPESDRVNVTGETNVYTKISVKYDELDNELKINKDVQYNIVNTITPTGQSYYNPVITDSYNTSLFIDVGEDPVSIVSNIVNSDNEITLIKIYPSSTLTNNIGGNILYELMIQGLMFQ